MKQLVRLNTRLSSNDKSFVYILRYTDKDGRRRWKSLGHANKRKAERQRIALEQELRMGLVEPGSMRLNQFVDDSLKRTGRQIRESTSHELEIAMRQFVRVVGDIDYLRVRHWHGEQFVQRCLDHGNAPATAAKKLRHLKRLFQLAVERGQLEHNPLKYVKAPRSPKKKIRTYDSDECRRMLYASQTYSSEGSVRWDLLILMAATTGMRRGELLNVTWRNIDFDARTVEVCPKGNTEETWEWHIKDTDRRLLPLTDNLVSLLVDHQARQPEGYPYVFVPRSRYDFIQRLRRKGKWVYSDSRLKVLNNFRRHFRKILQEARVGEGRFHDLRSTALSNWFRSGMSENDVMYLAGHSSFATTHNFYLAVADDLVERAREAAPQALGRELVQKWCAGLSSPESN